MTPRNIRQADLNLLIALNVLMEERNVTRAADRLDLTQSAASRMLGRLRATFDDPLFVRTSRGLTPTKRALDLAGPLQEYLAGLEKLLLERGDFDAATARRRFRIAAIDYVQAVLLAPLVAKLQHQAPQIDFEIRQPSTESERDLDAGVLDFLLMPQQRSGPGVVWTPSVPRHLHMFGLEPALGGAFDVDPFCRDGACVGCAARTGGRDR